MALCQDTKLNSAFTIDDKCIYSQRHFLLKKKTHSFLLTTSFELFLNVRNSTFY